MFANLLWTSVVLFQDAERCGPMGSRQYVAQYGPPGQDRCDHSVHYVRLVGRYHD